MNGVTTPTLTKIDRWHELYKAALFETDKKKIPTRIAEAEQGNCCARPRAVLQ
jgi:hypothetical protein